MNFTSIEEKGRKIFSKFPKTRRFLKKIYQISMYLISPKKIKCEGNVMRISPMDDCEYFFGYYDKSPWDMDDRYMISLQVKNAHKVPDSTDVAKVVVFDTENDNQMLEIGTTHCWNSQQGCMAQWLGPDFKSKIIYNDFRNNKYVSVIYNFLDKCEEKVIDMPIYDVSRDGTFALTLDFSRLHRLRKGYGYANLPEKNRNILCPKSPCVWKIDLKTGDITSVISYFDLKKFQTKPEMENAEHKVNHIMISPNGCRFMLLHRWIKNNEKFTRLITLDIDGSNLCNLSDDDFVSHCCWKNNSEILSFLRKKNVGKHYFLMKDKKLKYEMFWPRLNTDGHCTYSMNGEFIVTDTYPNRKRQAEIFICREENKQPVRIARLFSPFKYDNDVRCDLHPRWNHKGNKICIDSVHEGKKELYVIRLDDKDFPVIPSKRPKLIKGKYKIVYVITNCKNSGPMNQTLNIIKNLDRKTFQPIVITLFNEDLGNSVVQRYLDVVPEFYCLNMSKIQSILFGKKILKNKLEEINPDLVHGVGMPPYTLSLEYKNAVHLVTLRNYCYQDYPSKYGLFMGNLIAIKDMLLIRKQIKKGEKFLTCSESLSSIYLEKRNLKIDYIRNGVDVSKYSPASTNEKNKLKKSLKLPVNKTIFIYTGQIIDRKDQEFAIKGLLKSKHKSDAVLLLLGDGINKRYLEEKYKNEKNIVFIGSVNNVVDYLRASDIYVSTSKSEGMPNGVLEAMACGLPLILSNIPQHMELFSINENIGRYYSLNDMDSFVGAINDFNNSDLKYFSKNSYDCVNSNLTATKMSKFYQDIYKNLIETKNDGVD